MNESQHVPSAVGLVGLLGSLTLGEVNTIIGIGVGLLTLWYLVIRILKELRDGKTK